MAVADPNIVLAQTMPLPPQSIQDVFLTQGIIGAVALIALGVAAYLYKAREQDREKTAAAMDEQAERYEKRLAEKDAMNQKLQEDRLVEMKAATTELGKALQTVDQMRMGFESALEAVSKTRSNA